MKDALRVLVIEDEMTIALSIEDMLVELGYDVIDLAMRLPQGLALARSAEFDLAILDVNLDGRMSFPIADILNDRGVPYLFITGYGSAGIDPAYQRNRVIIKKPFDLADLRSGINRLLSHGSVG